MPELPEVETVVRELHKKLKERTIKSVEVRVPKLIGIGPAGLGNKRQETGDKGQVFAQLLRGQKIASVRRRAKLLLFDLQGPYTLLVHLKMTGQFIFEDTALRKKTGSKYRILNKLTAPLVQLPGKHTHVIFQFTDGATLYFNDVRKFAYLKLVRDDELGQVAELNEYGPEPLSKEFNLLLFLTAVKKRYKVSIKQVLMDNTVVVGIGNIYSDEILFQAQVRPDRTAGSLSKDEIQAIYASIRPVLLQGIKSKGSSVGDFVRTDGKWGSMGKFHYVYGRKGLLCKLCGTLIKSTKLGGRTSSFCPHCQR
jgi:formamidopyrimidine-DNA glycosylase